MRAHVPAHAFVVCPVDLFAAFIFFIVAAHMRRAAYKISLCRRPLVKVELLVQVCEKQHQAGAGGRRKQACQPPLPAEVCKHKYRRRQQGRGQQTESYAQNQIYLDLHAYIIPARALKGKRSPVRGEIC